MKPMLCKETKDLSILKDCLFEEKKDGERVILYRGRIINRRGFDITEKFPEIKAPDCMILDGELVTIDEDFSKIQSRVHLSNQFKISMVSRRCPAMVWVFDILAYMNDGTIKDLPLNMRKLKLKNCLPERDGIRILPFFYDFQDLLKDVKDRQLEGIVAKPLESRYIEDDRTMWAKWKFWKEDVVEFNGFEVNPDESITLFNMDNVRVKAPKQIMYEQYPIKAEIQFLERTENKAYRFPTFKRVVK